MTRTMKQSDKLKAVERTLFPPSRKNKDGSKTLFDADENLDAALYDLRRTKADKACISTVTKVLAQLAKVRAIINPPAWHEK